MVRYHGPDHSRLSLPSQPSVNLASLRLRCFGTPSLCVEGDDGESQLLLPAGKPLLILVYLTVHLERGASRETLTALGWGERDDANAKASLRQTLYRLRQFFGRAALTEEGTTIRLTLAIASDWAAANRAVADGDDVALLATVQGRFLDGLDADDDAGNDWLAAERMRWDRQLREAAVREGRRVLVAGQIEEALVLAERSLASGPDHLATWTLYLDALAATGIVTRLEDGLARLEAAGEHGSLGAAAPQGWRLLARRLRRGLEHGDPSTEPSAPTGVLPFTGRAAVLAHLQQLLRLPPQEPRRIIAVVASAGFGKSRLLRELRRRQTSAGGVMVSIDARVDEATTPFTLLNRIVDALTELPEALGIDPAEAEVLVAANPRLATRFGRHDRTAPEAPTRAALAGALDELVSAVSERHPLHLVVDDAQWGDEASLTLLATAFSGQGTGQAVCLFATRDLTAAMSSQWFTLHLSSLTADDIATLLATELPSLPATVHPKAAEAVLLVTGGVPIYVMRALQRLNILAAEGSRGDDLLAVIPSLVLHRDPAFPSGNLDRRVLGYLAIAGGTVVEAELAALADVGSPSAARDRLARLERSGWVERNSTGFQLSHDLVRQQAIEGLSPDEQRDLSLQHVRWLGLHGDGLHDLQRAVRISLAQGDEAEAVRAVRHWRRRVRGGPRGRALATIVLPADAPRGMRWRVSAAATPALLRLVLGMTVLLALGGWGVVGWLRQPARLSLDNTPSVPGIDILHPGRVRRNMIPPSFTVRDRLGRISTALDGMPLDIAGWSGPVDSARLEAPTRVTNGQITATTLVVHAGLQDSLEVSFRVGQLPALRVTVFRGFDTQSLAIVGGMLNGQPITPHQPEVVVAPGDSLVGFVQLRYTTPSQAALWMLAGSSTMRPAIEDTLTVITLHTRARDAITEPFVDRRAPRTPGVYWLVWTFAPERDAVSILSLTNWSCGAPHWNDGNDLATVPDSALRSVWGGGVLWLARDMCEEGGPPQRLRTMYPAATVRVVVESR